MAEQQQPSRRTSLTDMGKRKLLIAYLCKAMKLIRDLGLVDDEWNCDSLAAAEATSVLGSIFNGVLNELNSASHASPPQDSPQMTDLNLEGIEDEVIRQNTPEIHPQTTHLNEDNVEQPIIRETFEEVIPSLLMVPETSGHSSGIGLSLSPARQPEVEDVFEVTDIDDRPPSELILTPQKPTKRLTPALVPTPAPTQVSFDSQESPPESLSSFRPRKTPRYIARPHEPVQKHPYCDIVRAFDDLVQNMTEHSRILNESRLGDRTCWQTHKLQIGRQYTNYDSSESTEDEENSSYFQPQTMSTPPPSTSQPSPSSQRQVIIDGVPSTSGQDAFQAQPTSSPFKDHQADQLNPLIKSSDELPQIIVTPVKTTRPKNQDCSHKVSHSRKEGRDKATTDDRTSETQTSALIYITVTKGAGGAEKKTVKEFILDPNFKGG